MRPFGKYLIVNRILRFAIYIQNTLFEEKNIELGWALRDSINIKNIMQ